MKKLMLINTLLFLLVMGCKKEEDETFDILITSKTSFNDGTMTIWKLEPTTSKVVIEEPLRPDSVTQITIENAKIGESYKVYITQKIPDSTSIGIVKWFYDGKEIVEETCFNNNAYRSENLITVK